MSDRFLRRSIACESSEPCSVIFSSFFLMANTSSCAEAIVKSEKIDKLRTEWILERASLKLYCLLVAERAGQAQIQFRKWLDFVIDLKFTNFE